MLPSCCILLTDFKTVFVFALGPFLPMKVIFFDFNGNLIGKWQKIINGHFGHIWPFMAIWPFATNMGKWNIPENLAQQY